ncbi:hypothetical protein [Thermus caldilimi]|uniref:hypothetical protein n=1 Tax=Thermus caldilimi TaxID=2483360 RepID=UPI00107616ED|nr:hypothetical protein [Thermus caldilimi]
MFQVRDPQKALRAIAFVRYGMAALFLLLALLQPEKLLFLGLAFLALAMARTGYCPLLRR